MFTDILFDGNSSFRPEAVDDNRPMDLLHHDGKSSIAVLDEPIRFVVRHKSLVPIAGLVCARFEERQPRMENSQRN